MSDSNIDNTVDDYIVVCDEDLSKVISKIKELTTRHNYKLYWDLFVVRTNYVLNITMRAEWSISGCWESPGWSYTGTNVWTGTPTWKNIYHQVLVHYKGTSLWVWIPGHTAENWYIGYSQ